MRHYRITVSSTKERYELTAPSAQEACERMGYQIGECYVEGPSDEPIGRQNEPAREPEKA